MLLANLTSKHSDILNTNTMDQIRTVNSCDFNSDIKYVTELQEVEVSASG
jgi:hypothetical protein